MSVITKKKHWHSYTLEEICLKITDGAHASPKSKDSGYPMASVKDLTPFGIDFQSCRLISEEDFEKLVRQGCKPEVGDVLIAKDGNSALDTVCEVKEDNNVVLLSSVAILKPNPQKIDSAFLRYYLDSDITRSYLKQGFISGAAIPRVILADFKRAKIVLPNLQTQIHISSILSAFDDLIENNTKRIKILEEMARLIYKEWFVYFRFPDHEKVKMVDSGTELGEIPEGWEVKPLKDFGEVITGKTPSKANPDFYGLDVPFVKTPDMHNQVFILSTTDCLSENGASSQANKMIPAKSLCVSCIGTIGVVSITSEVCQTNQQINSIVPNKTEYYGYLFFCLKDMKQLLENLGSNGATMGNVNKGKFESIEVLAPDFNLLEQYHYAVSPVFDLILSLAKKNTALRSLRDLLLPKLISGQLDVSPLAIPSTSNEK